MSEEFCADTAREPTDEELRRINKQLIHLFEEELAGGDEPFWSNRCREWITSKLADLKGNRA